MSYKDKILYGDALEQLKTIPDETVQMCVTSPPYWGLRDYGVEGQLGLEETPEEYVEKLTAVFSEVKRVLKDDGTLWLNIGDSYNGSCMTGGKNSIDGNGKKEQRMFNRTNNAKGLKPKDLCMIPARTAIALQAAGWYLRSDIIWHKPNPMPESVKDRPTNAHEHVFLLSKNKKYYYDWEAIAEDTVTFDNHLRDRDTTKLNNTPGRSDMKGLKTNQYNVKNKRSVWSINTKPFPEAHFAVYPPDLIAPCIKAGSKPYDIVLDPFFGSGTTGKVCKKLNRHYLGIELNKEYEPIQKKRLQQNTLQFKA